MGFMGYSRADGRVGVRNHVVVMSSVSCANAVVEHIGRALPEVKTITHTEGCGRGPLDVSVTLRTLADVAAHPNVAGVLLVGLGCEVIKAELVASRAADGKRVEWIGIQQGGGSLKVTREMESGLNELLRIPLPAVIEVQAGINHPRYASLRGIMQAKKKEIASPAPADLGVDASEVGAAASRLEVLNVSLPDAGGGAQMLEGDPEAVARELIDKLRREAKVL